MNLFRLAGDMTHVLSILVLLLRLQAAKNANGISLKTQELYLVRAQSHSFACLLTLLLTYLLIDSLTYLLVHSLTHSLALNLIIVGSVRYPIFRFIYHLYIVVQHNNEDSVHICDIVHHLHDYEYG